MRDNLSRTTGTPLNIGPTRAERRGEECDTAIEIRGTEICDLNQTLKFHMRCGLLSLAVACRQEQLLTPRLK